MKRWIIALVALLVVVGGGWVWASPQITLWQLKQAAEARDADAIAAYVDFPAVRESLKVQLRDRVGSQGGGPLESFASALANRFADPVVDAAVTPEGMRAIFAAGAASQAGKSRPMGLDAGKMVIRRDAIDRFRLVRSDGSGGELLFMLRGLGWKLVEIRVPDDALL